MSFDTRATPELGTDPAMVMPGAPSAGSSDATKPQRNSPAVEPSRIESEALAVAFAEELITLQAAIAEAPKREDAVRVFAKWLAALLPGSQVRIAWGDSKIRGLVCGRLGALGTNSDVWHGLEEDWPNLCGQGDDASNKENSAEPAGAPSSGTIHTERLQRDHGELLRLVANTDDPTTYIVAIHYHDHARALLDALLKYDRSVTALLESRPQRDWVASAFARRKYVRFRYLLVLASLLVVACFPVPYRAHCKAVVQPKNRRTIAVPFDATLLATHTRPGDRIAAGDLLFELDGRPLKLELEGLKADLGHARKRQRSQLAKGKVAEAQLAALESEQLANEIALVTERLAKLQVRSPLDGVVVSGELTAAIGTPFETGASLLEIAPLDAMTVEFEIPEEEIRFIDPGSAAKIRFDAAIGEVIEAELHTVFPKAEVRDDANVFVGRWEFEHPPSWLRPGMRGSAIVYGPRRPVIWPWLRGLHEASLRAIGW